MKKKSSTKKPRIKPELKWQTGEYERYAQFNFILPPQFLLLCKLMDATPKRVLSDFMDNLSCGSWRREGRDTAKEHLINYFITHGYGKHNYTETDIRKMFNEMDAVGLLFPKPAKSKMLDVYSKWREKHQANWFKHWFKKPGRKLLRSA